MTPFFVPGAELPERQVTHLKTFDTAIVFWKDEPSTLAPNQLVGSGLTANLRRAGVREVFAVNPFPPAGQKTHAATHMLQALEPIVGRGHDPVPRIFLSAADKTFGANFIAQMGLKGFGGGLIAAHPGSGGKHKRWPASHFAELMERARHRQTRMSAPHGAQWLLICGPADEQACEEVCADLRLVTPHIVKDVSLVQLAAVISECRAYVGNDSGVTHIAAAVGAPTVAVFGPTDPNVWGPVGERVRVAAPHAIVASATPTPGTTVLWPSVEQVWQALAAMCSYHS
jgi:heptosyltransferase-2